MCLAIPFDLGGFDYGFKSRPGRGIFFGQGSAEGISQSKHAPRREITVVRNGDDPAARSFFVPI